MTNKLRAIVHTPAQQQWDNVLTISKYCDENIGLQSGWWETYKEESCIHLNGKNSGFGSKGFYQDSDIPKFTYQEFIELIISSSNYSNARVLEAVKEFAKDIKQPSAGIVKLEDVPKYKTLELLSNNITTFTKAAKLAGIDENYLDNYSKLLIELSVGGVELSCTFHPDL